MIRLPPKSYRSKRNKRKLLKLKADFKNSAFLKIMKMRKKKTWRFDSKKVKRNIYKNWKNTSLKLNNTKMLIIKIRLLSSNLNIKWELMNVKKLAKNMKNLNNKLGKTKSSKQSVTNYKITLFKYSKKKIRRSISLDQLSKKKNNRFFVCSNISKIKIYKSETWTKLLEKRKNFLTWSNNMLLSTKRTKSSKSKSKIMLSVRNKSQESWKKPLCSLKKWQQSLNQCLKGMPSWMRNMRMKKVKWTRVKVFSNQ